MGKVKHPNVSVVVTCYNYGRYLSGALQSVLDQTYQDFELIVVNDGSIDNTKEVVQPYLKNANVFYIEQTNSGQASAKNAGINKARGEFLAFLDADDLWDKSKLEEQIPLLADRNIGVVYSRAVWFDDNGKIIEFKKIPKQFVPRIGKVTRFMVFDNFVPFSSSVVRRECIEKYGAFDETLSMGIDWDLWLRLSVHCDFSYVEKELIRYRVGHSGQMSSKQEERLKSAERILEGFLAKNPNVIPERIKKGAWSYTYSNRGFFWRRLNVRKSNNYFWRAVRENPLNLDAYRGLIQNMIVRCS